MRTSVNKSVIRLGLVVLLFCVVSAGCASTQKTTKTTTTETYSTEGENKGYLRDSTTTNTSDTQQVSQVSEKTETTTTTSDKKPEHHSILGSTLHAIGWVIALPFRLVGGLIGWIF